MSTALHFHDDQTGAAAELCERFHYSGRYPANASLAYPKPDTTECAA